MFDPISGNLTYPSFPARPEEPVTHKIKDTCEIFVETKWFLGKKLPYLITWPETRKTYKIDRIFETSIDPSTGIIEFGVKIGSRTTKIWRRPDGSYYTIRRRKSNRVK